MIASPGSGLLNLNLYLNLFYRLYLMITRSTATLPFSTVILP